MMVSRFMAGSGRFIEVELTQVEKERQTERNAHRRGRDQREPEMPNAPAASFAEDEKAKHSCGDDNVAGEKGADAVCEKLGEKEPEIEAMMREPGKELRIRQCDSERAKSKINVTPFHIPPV